MGIPKKIDQQDIFNRFYLPLQINDEMHRMVRMSKELKLDRESGSPYWNTVDDTSRRNMRSFLERKLNQYYSQEMHRQQVRMVAMNYRLSGVL